MMLRLFTLLLALGLSAATADDTPAGSDTGKVVQYEAGGGTMLANARIDWARYTGILLEGATVSFKEDWAKEQERLNNNIVREADKARIRSGMADMLQDVLAQKISATEGYVQRDSNGADVLRFSPRIVKLDVRAPGKIQGIVGNVLVDGKGSLVIVMDIGDSVSGELLASAWRLEVDPDKGFMETATEAGNKTAFKRMMENWSDWFFAMLDHVRTAQAGG